MVIALRSFIEGTVFLIVAFSAAVVLAVSIASSSALSVASSDVSLFTTLLLPSTIISSLFANASEAPQAKQHVPVSVVATATSSDTTSVAGSSFAVLATCCDLDFLRMAIVLSFIVRFDLLFVVFSSGSLSFILFAASSKRGASSWVDVDSILSLLSSLLASTPNTATATLVAATAVATVDLSSSLSFPSLSLSLLGEAVSSAASHTKLSVPPFCISSTPLSSDCAGSCLCSPPSIVATSSEGCLSVSSFVSNDSSRCSLFIFIELLNESTSPCSSRRSMNLTPPTSPK